MKFPIVDTNSTSSTFATTTKLYEEEEDNEDSVALYEPSAPKVKVFLIPLDFKPSNVLSDKLRYNTADLLKLPSD